MESVLPKTCDADHVYVLLTDKHRVSRNHRAKWFLHHLNRQIKFEPRKSIDDFEDEINIVSCVVSKFEENASKEYSGYVNITTNTKFTFLSRKYCLVYVLDLTSSTANIDIQHSSILTDELYNALSMCLTNLVKPFFVPGSQLLFEPDIFLTILVYNPYYCSDANNVIVHGFKLCFANVDKLLSITRDKLNFFVQLLHENIAKFNSDNTLANNKNRIVPSDVSLVNMIRFGLLSLNLLPDNNQEGIVIVTDGNISFPDGITLESALAQLRHSMISCSFIQIGSPPHPDFSFGYVPYIDFMKFISVATFGSYLAISPDYVCNFEPNSFNVFHRAYFVWNFHYGHSSIVKDLRTENFDLKIWSIGNPYFYSSKDADLYDSEYQQKDQHLLRRKQLENRVNADLQQLLSYRLREGFTIKYIHFVPNDNNFELLLVLPWRYNVNIEYHIIASYHPDGVIVDDEEQRLTYYEIFVESCYNFLHDVSCSVKKFKSPFRDTTIRQYLNTIKSFADSDQLGIHFYNFARNDVYRCIPETIKNGVPLFYLPPSGNEPVISFCTNESHIKLSQYWKPICMLDVNLCQKSSLHTHRINILLRHDMPLPEYLYHPNASCRYDNIQCNQAMSVLNVMLKEWSSFVLLENHSYIKFIESSENNISSFYLIRVISQPPCIVLHLSFIGGTCGSLRSEIVNELVQKLKLCKLPQRNLSSSLVQKSSAQNEELNDDLSNEESNDMVDMGSEHKEINDEFDQEENGAQSLEFYKKSPEKRITSNKSHNPHCFVLLNRPIERILLRYEKVPNEFFSCHKYEEDCKSKSNMHTSINMFQTLTRFLHHKRFIWSTHNSPHTPLLSISAVSRILSELTMKRINEGFHLAYNNCGMVNLVMEVIMKDDVGCEFPCLIQYIIFPSNLIVSSKESTLDEEDDDTNSQSRIHLIVSECWVEAQNGNVCNVFDQSDHFLQDLNYHQIYQAFYHDDLELVTALLTYEHLVAYTAADSTFDSLRNKAEQNILQESSNADHEANLDSKRFCSIPYNFDLFRILDKSKQALLTFYMLYQLFDSIPEVEEKKDNDLPKSNLDNCTNIMLFSEFLLKLSKIHDKEIEFSHLDSIIFIKQVNHRFARYYTNQPQFFVGDIDETVLFRCFCKQISINCIILTILPANYQVLRKLSLINDCNNKFNEQFVKEIENTDGELHGRLILPIFVHKLTFQSLSKILQNSCDLDELNEVNATCGKVYFDQNSLDNIPFTDEIALGDFCQEIGTLYWNSFADAVYKSLRCGFPVDKRDITLVLEKICLRLFEYVEITEFLIYTCKHIKPMINAYLSKYPNHNIFDLLNYILKSFISLENVNNIDELVSLNDIPFSTSTSCQINGDLLKTTFRNLINSHFTSIPEFANNYYFYDYDNIQSNKFTFGASDIKKYTENILKFYEGVENKIIDLEKFYDKVKFYEQDNKDNDQLKKEFKDDAQLSENEDEDVDYQPLLLMKPFFIGFSYTIYLKSGPQICKTSSIPVCISELLKEHSYKDIELENFRIFLKIEIFTQNFENPIVSNSKRISVSSNETTPCSKDIISLISQTLDPFQVYKYKDFVDQIEWIIRNEIVSLSHKLFQICPATLQMVVEHINNTGNSNFSFIDKVYLKFVFQMDLNDLRNLLKELKFSNFQLCELGDYFYVIHQSFSYQAFDNSEKNIVQQMSTDTKDRVDNIESVDDLPKESLIAEYTIDETDSNLSPNFWLIIEFKSIDNKNFIYLYFHSRQNIYLYGLEIFNELKKSIEQLCKKVNQKSLLDELHSTKECNQLLISVDDKDHIFKNNIRSTLNSTPISQAFFENYLENDFEIDTFNNQSLKVLRSNFTPGAFICDVVWEKHFSLHPRLHSKDRINSIKAVLSSFKVTNRNNLYVYQENSGSVFYFRIYEIECGKHVYSEELNYSELSDTISNDGDTNKHLYYDNIINSSDIIDNQSIKLESDRDNDSITSQGVIKSMDRSSSQQCVLLRVHGINEPGSDIKEGMVEALQKKLDEAVLDMLVLMLARNPLSKLSFEDVSFIQSCNSVCDNYYFMINESCYPYILNIKAYIRQNLSTFMYNPKYIDSHVESHFKIFKNGEFCCVKDDDIFILNCHQSVGKDHKGIVCVILSIVSKEKVSDFENNFSVPQSELNDLISGNFEHITYCYCQTNENDRVKFYINFQIWSVGKIDMNYLDQKLLESVKNALWDFNLEFKIFKLCYIEENKINPHSISEPSTPKKLNDKRERRSGLTVVTSSRPSITQADNGSLLATKLRQPSTASAVEVSSNENYFDFSSIEIKNEAQDNEELFTYKEFKNKETQYLSYKLNFVLKPWLDFGKEISVPALKKYQFPIIFKNSLSSIVKEFIELINEFISDMKIHFLPSSIQQYYDFDLTSNNFFEDSNNFMILFNHENLWNCISLNESESSFSQIYCRIKNEHSKLFFPPIFQSKLESNLTSNISISDIDSFRCIIPRQKFLLLHVEGHYMTLYLYNWSTQHCTNILSIFSTLIVWNNIRSLLLQSLILQKAGIMHNYPFKRYSFESVLSMSNVPYHYLSRQPSNNEPSSKYTQNVFKKVFKNIDLLLKHKNPFEAEKEFQANVELLNRADIIFDIKNYDYIFSDFQSADRQKNIYDCFNGQFNSDVNIYIKDLKELCKVCQVHGAKQNYVTMDKITRLVKTYGRLSHFCLTPFLFSPKWRYMVSLVRDYSFPMSQSRSRHMSGGNLSKPIEREFTVSNRSRRKSGPANIFDNSLSNRTSQDETLDKSVCPHYIQEYVQYLQSLGFTPIKSKKLSGLSTKKSSDFDRTIKPKLGVFNRKSIQRNETEKIFLIKTLIGGFYLFEIGFCEPYVYSYLYSFESKRFSSWNKSEVLDMNITSFLDELDSIKIRMHLHSFTYDYHLRAIHSYISGRKLFFHLGYHLISFLDDFIKYYQKAPNYARNQIYLSYISFESKRINKADQLYNYITGNNKLYDMEVLRMDSLPYGKHETSKEYLLIRMSSHQVPYSDDNKNKQEDNFDVGVLVSHYKNRELIPKDNVLLLKFFILLTSQRELFPKLCSHDDNRGQYQAIRVSPSISTCTSRKSSIITNDITSDANYILVRPQCNLDATSENNTFSKIHDENINYLGYFNTHEISMLNILNKKVDETKTQLLEMIEFAEIDCRRDFLWNNLMKNSAQEPTISLEELNELLSLVKSIRIDEYDINLQHFYMFNYQWYKSLSQKLELKFEFTHRKFTKDNSIKMAFFKTNCQNCFILFHLTPLQVELKIVFKKSPNTSIDTEFLQNCNTQYHELIEDFINACTSHMWSVLV